MNQRLVQMIARYGALGFTTLTMWLGVEVDKGNVDSIMLPIATGIVALAGIVADHYIHKLQDKLK